MEDDRIVGIACNSSNFGLDAFELLGKSLNFVLEPATTKATATSEARIKK